jgi:MoaA/NifB/PqqE/SkfB family radical SAM enzyme
MSKLKACLDSLFAQTYAKDSFEIIVIDDGSADGSKDMLREFSKTNSNLRYFIQNHKGPAAARNLGIKAARAQIIGFTDSDCILDKDWIKYMVEGHSLDSGVAAIGGATEVDKDNIKSQVSQFLSDGAIEAQISGKQETIFFPTCNVSFKREYIRVFHDCHTDLGSFLRQAYMYGRGNYLVQYMHRDHPLLKEIKTKNNPVFIFGLIVNFIKIPRFSCLLGKRLIRSRKGLSLYQKSQVYIYFVLHKINYLVGNCLEHARARKMRNQGSLRPELVILDLTHKCNLSCNICEIRKDKPIKEYSLKEAEEIIRQACSWQVKDFALSGGEPLMRADIFEILDFVKKNKYHIGILTNGVILSDVFIKRLLPYLAGGFLSLSISLDALTPEIHDDIRGTRGCFEKTSGAFKRLAELKKEYPGINFNSISIILNENLEELPGLADFFKSLNINSIQFQALLSNNLIMKERKSSSKYWISPERFAALDTAIDRLIDFKRKNPVLVRNSENNLRLVKKYFRGTLNREEAQCQYADKTVLIANTGEVTTCFESYGNIRKNNLKAIYSSKNCLRARERVKMCKHPCLLPCFCD